MKKLAIIIAVVLITGIILTACSTSETLQTSYKGTSVDNTQTGLVSETDESPNDYPVELEESLAQFPSPTEAPGAALISPEQEQLQSQPQGGISQNPATQIPVQMPQPTPLPTTSAPLPAIDASVGMLAPDFTLTTLDGKQLTLSELRGRFIVLNFWTSWCIPCEEEQVVLTRLQQEYQAENLVVLSVNAIEEDIFSDVQRAAQDRGIKFPIMLDQDSIVKESYRVLFFPTSIFIDQNGVIKEILLGSKPEVEFKQKVENLIFGAS